MSASSLLRDAVATVYRQPLERFVEARADEVRRLRDAGEAATVQALAKLRKPSTRLWALNQIGAVAGDDLGGLFAQGDRLRDAQRRLLHGERDAAADLREAALQQRRLADVLARRAGMVLTAAGHGAADTLVRDLAAVLASAAVASEDVRTALRAGALVDEPGPAGFPEPDDTAVAAAPPAPTPPRPSDTQRAAEVERNRLESEARLARERAQRRAAEADDLERRAGEARAEADRARREAETAETRLQQAISSAAPDPR